jgi:hypothetical protein
MRRALVKRFGRKLAELKVEWGLTHFLQLARIRTLTSFTTWLPRKLIGWNLGFEGPGSGGGSRAAYSEGIALFGLVITNGVVFAISQQQATSVPGGLLLATYAAVATTAIIGMCCMLNAKSIESPHAISESKTPPPWHAYERGSIMFIRSVFTGSIAVTVLFFWMAWSGQLPGQTFAFEKDAELGYPQTHLFADKTRGIIVPVNLNRTLFPRGIPPQLNMYVSISAPLKKIWEMDNEVIGLIDDGGKRMDPQPVVVQNLPDLERTTVLLDNLTSDGRYVLKIYLHGQKNLDPTIEDITAAIEAISNKKAMKVAFATKQQEKKDK